MNEFTALNTVFIKSMFLPISKKFVFGMTFYNVITIQSTFSAKNFFHNYGNALNYKRVKDILGVTFGFIYLIYFMFSVLIE